jgi:hypothetical protein
MHIATTVSPISVVSGVTSEPVQLRIQGLLGAPSNLMLSEADEEIKLGQAILTGYH